MTYKYCTAKMVDKAVKQGREAVIQCASDKWWFFGTCTEKQFSRYASYGLARNCALCVAFPNCTNCPLFKHQGGYCAISRDLYGGTVMALWTWEDNPTATNFKKFQAKARKLARVIGRLK